MFNFQDKDLFSFDESIKDQAKDRRKWGKGEWENEPNYFSFSYVGYYCTAKRNELGMWIGQIMHIPLESKYNNELERSKLKTYGVLLYRNSGYSFTLGFSCCRPCHDLVPAAIGIVNIVNEMITGKDAGKQIDKILNEMKLELPNDKDCPLYNATIGTYKNVAFVVKELKALVDQLV